MPVKLQSLAGLLRRELPGVTWVHGNEPLLVIEAGDAVRASLRAQGYDEKLVFHVDRHFDPASLDAEVNAMSLFASRKLIELRFPARVGKEMCTRLAELAGTVSDDIRLLVTSERPDGGVTRSAAYKNLDKAGLIVEIFPVDHNRLPEWIAQRLEAQQQQAEPALLRVIAERVEGNLLAASQEIRKLALLFEPGLIPTEAATTAVLEVARYEGQDLTEAILDADIARTRRSLDGMVSQGQAETLVIWHLAECARSILRLQDALHGGAPLRPVFNQIRAFGPRQRLYEQAARRLSPSQAQKALTDAARADTMAKGFEKGDAWPLIRRVALGLAGARLPDMPAAALRRS